MNPLTNHLLLNKVNELDGLSDKDLAKACGYIGKLSGKSNFPLFKKELELANKPIRVTSAVTVILSEDAEACLGSIEHLQALYPSLSHLTAPEQSKPITITAYIGDREPSGLPESSLVFAIVSGEESPNHLISDVSILKELWRVLLRSLVSTKKESYLATYNAFRRLKSECPAIDPAGTLLSRFSLPALAGVLFSAHCDRLPIQILEELKDTCYYPQIERFLPKGQGKVIASYRPCYNYLWSRDGDKGYIEKDLLKSLEKCSRLVFVEYQQVFIEDGCPVILEGWNDIVCQIDRYTSVSDGWISGLNFSDKLNWHLLLDTQQLTLST